MAAYRDSADWLRNGIRSGHLICDSRAELLALAAQLELPERFFQSYAMLPHYQLPVAYQEAADALGVTCLERAAYTRMVGRVSERWDAAERGQRKPPSPSPRPARTEPPPRKSADAETRAPEQQSLL